MDIKTVILNMYPYWILGIAVIMATFFSDNKDLLRIQPDSLFKFFKIMMLVTAIRCTMMHFFPPTLASAAPVLQIPLAMTGTVFWEDACHTLPLAIMGRWLGDSIFSKIIMFALTVMVMVSFGLGHVYQGTATAFMLAFYIPIVTRLGKEHGFGTVMLCHMFYDFITLLTIRLFLGL